MPRNVEPAIVAGTMASSRQPTIAVDGELTLRPWCFADCDRVIAAFGDPAIRRWHARRVDTRLEARKWIGYGHALWLREQCANFAVVDTADVVVGRVAIYTDLVAAIGEISYWVLPDSRRQQIASRAGVAATRWGHQTLGLRRVLLEHTVDNTASCAVAQRLGYDLEGTARSLHLLSDGHHDVHIHASVTT